MPRAHDTTSEADAAQFAVYRRMSDSRRLELALQMSDEARRITAEGIHDLHPEFTDAEVEDVVRLLVLGPKLFHEAWPDKPLPYNLRRWGSNDQGQLGYGHTNNIGDNELPVVAGPVSY